MCNFMSFISSGDGKVYYFTAAKRHETLFFPNGDKVTDYDSPASIATYFCVNEDTYNKWEYNPFTEELKLDQQNTADDRGYVRTTIDQIPDDDWRSMCGNLWAIRALIAESKVMKWFDVSGEYPECVKMFDTWDAASDAAGDAASDAAWAAASDAALMARIFVCDGLELDQKHIEYAKLRWSIWKSGYGVYCDINGVLCCYKKII